MKSAADELAEYLKNVAFRQPEIRVIHNVDVATHQTVDEIKNALVQQLYRPVRWTETVNLLAQEGVMQAAECSPGKVLAGLAKRIHKEMVCAALVSQTAIDEFITAQSI